MSELFAGFVLGFDNTVREQQNRLAVPQNYIPLLVFRIFLNSERHPSQQRQIEDVAV